MITILGKLSLILVVFLYTVQARAAGYLSLGGSSVYALHSKYELEYNDASNHLNNKLLSQNHKGFDVSLGFGIRNSDFGDYSIEGGYSRIQNISDIDDKKLFNLDNIYGMINYSFTATRVSVASLSIGAGMGYGYFTINDTIMDSSISTTHVTAPNTATTGTGTGGTSAVSAASPAAITVQDFLVKKSNFAFMYQGIANLELALSSLASINLIYKYRGSTQEIEFALTENHDTKYRYCSHMLGANIKLTIT